MQKNKQMEEVQREAKACKSCTHLTKINIPNIWERQLSYNKQYNKTNKASKIYLTRHVQKKLNMLNVMWHYYIKAWNRDKNSIKV